jgi:hypothetical protein
MQCMKKKVESSVACIIQTGGLSINAPQHTHTTRSTRCLKLCTSTFLYGGVKAAAFMSVTTTSTEAVAEAAAVAPRITLNASKPNALEKHRDYYMPNGNVVIQVCVWWHRERMLCKPTRRRR